MLYDSIEEANTRLSGTIVTYEGRPVFVRDVESHADGVMRVNFTEFPFRGENVRKKINSPHFKRFVTPPIGYMNFFDGGITHASFCERLPSRQRRQGLSSETFRASTIMGNRVDFRIVQSSEAFREMIAGEYPTFDDAMGRLVPNSSIAIDREFAVQQTPEGYCHLLSKRDNIGVIVRNMLYLRPDRRYMVECIVENPNLPDRVEVM